MNLEESLKKLFSLHQFGIKLGLENIQSLLNYIGNPESSFKSIHIAGSNGKGSTASFISSILIEAGFKTGLYTSPHLVQFNERIRINGSMMPDHFVVNFMNELSEYIDEHSPTFFELTTAMAFKYFDNNNVDYAVIETGLGGRLDATNVLTPLTSVITTISREHTNILGNDLQEIASEKGGIIKKDSNVIIGLIADTAIAVLVDKAISMNSQYFLLENFIKRIDDSIELRRDDEQILVSNLPLRGSYQLNNAALAALTISVTKPEINKNQILRGLDNVIINSGIQARYEIFHDNPKIIFDAAHNFEGIEKFIHEFKNESMNYHKRTVIYGTMKDKDYFSILNELKTVFDTIYITEVDNERAATIEDVSKEAQRAGIKVMPMINSAKFINEFMKGNVSDCLVILGSIYVLGEIKINLQIYLDIKS